MCVCVSASVCVCASVCVACWPSQGPIRRLGRWGDDSRMGSIDGRKKREPQAPLPPSSNVEQRAVRGRRTSASTEIGLLLIRTNIDGGGSKGVGQTGDPMMGPDVWDHRRGARRHSRFFLPGMDPDHWGGCASSLPKVRPGLPVRDVREPMKARDEACTCAHVYAFYKSESSHKQ